MKPRLRRPLSLLALAVTVGAVAVGSQPVSAAGHRLAVTGFQESSSPVRLIDRSAAAMTTVGVDGVTLRPSGASVNAPGRQAAAQRSRANHDGLRAELLVSNFSDAIEDFSEPLGHALLSSRAHINAVAAQLVDDVNDHGWDGISVDLESLLPRDRAGLSHFVERLHATLPHRATLSICVENFTHSSDYAANGYNLRTINRNVNRVMLMAYDEHGPWENTPGPIGALQWERAGVSAALHFVPRSHLDLGVAGYGYAWRPHSNDTLSDAQARRLAGSRARFDSSVGEWTASLKDGSTLWWSDARSFRLRVALARKMGLHGLAMWSLGQSDPLKL